MRTAQERRDALKAVWRQASTCTRCPQLAATRSTVVFGSGNADADLMIVGEAPGANEDRLGLPFVGQAGQLLDRLLGEIGLARADIFITNTLKCRPPGNRDPLPQELEHCREYLWAQLELVQPRVVCTLGNFATKLLRGDPSTGITRLHGRPEERVLGGRAVRLYPLYHPAAALYTPAMLATLREDVARLPELLALPALEQPVAVAVDEVAVAVAADEARSPSGEAATGSADAVGAPHVAVVVTTRAPAGAGGAEADAEAESEAVGGPDAVAEPAVGEAPARPPEPVQLGLF